MSKKQHRAIAKRIPFDRLIAEVAHRTDIPKYKADEVVRATFASIKDILFSKCLIDIPRFGSFYLLVAKGNLFNLPNGEKVWKGKRLLGKFKFAVKFKKELEKVKINDGTEENDINDIIL